MSHESDRDALFGPVKAGGLKHKANASANRDALFGPAAGEEQKKKRAPKSRATASKTASSSSMPSATTTSTTTRPSSSRNMSEKTKNPTTARRLASKSAGRTGGTLRGDARVQKLKEAEELRAKAKKCMAKGFFSSPDPLAASNYYRRAADAYKQCGEFQLERVHRVASADSQMAQQAYATAATEYARAAEIVAQEETNDQTDLELRRNQVYQLYCKASDAWQQQGNTQKAGQALLDAALGLLLTDDADDDNVMQMERRGLTAMEEAVESFVPDVLNRYSSYRQTGTSSFVNADTGEGDVELARHHMVKHAYGHEPLQRALNIFVHYQEYRSALYAAGAASALLEADPHVTITLHRSYVAETILALAMGDVVAANQYFTSVHLQKSSYLTSRECKLAEECIRAIQQYDEEALEEALSKQGSNRAAVANLDANIREVALHLRVRGTVSKTRKDSNKHHDGHKKKSSTKKKKSRPPPEKVVDEEDVKEVEEVQASIEETIAELDNLMGDMGLDKDGDDDDGTNAYNPDNPESHSRPAPAKYTADDQDDFEDDDDDDIDLR
eukprot:scaffold6205_cov52-Attheya_sp.AAC.3